MEGVGTKQYEHELAHLSEENYHHDRVVPTKLNSGSNNRILEEVKENEVGKNINRNDGIVVRKMCNGCEDKHCKEEETNKKKRRSCSDKWLQQG